ncbi:MAG: hypothetical protein L3J97_00295 [Thermoplasmata archaeon]|nr:hypothetical protein [Thermoplasmata archaeon]
MESERVARRVPCDALMLVDPVDPDAGGFERARRLAKVADVEEEGGVVPIRT